MRHDVRTTPSPVARVIVAISDDGEEFFKDSHVGLDNPNASLHIDAVGRRLVHLFGRVVIACKVGSDRNLFVWRPHGIGYRFENHGLLL